jgi:hypothetical protein
VKPLTWVRFVQAVLGGAAGTFLAWIVSPGLTVLTLQEPSNVGCLTFGAFLGILYALQWGGSFVIPITVSALGGLLGGVSVLSLPAADARAHHLDMGDTAYEGAAVFVSFGALLGAVLGCIGGVVCVKRLGSRTRLGGSKGDEAEDLEF